jgi:CheY-like chemotaxis protein
MGNILEEVVPASQETCPDAAAAPGKGSSSTVSVLGCPAGGEADELALRMFRQLLGPAGCQFQVLSSETLAAELLSRIEEEQPALVCIATLPPAGLAGARYLCKRLRGRFPDLKIVVGRWGQVEKREEAESRLLAAGAESVTTSMLATRSELLPLLQVASAQSASEGPAIKAASRERQSPPSSVLAGVGAGDGLADK